MQTALLTRIASAKVFSFLIPRAPKQAGRDQASLFLFGLAKICSALALVSVRWKGHLDNSFASLVGPITVRACGSSKMYEYLQWVINDSCNSTHCFWIVPATLRPTHLQISSLTTGTFNNGPTLLTWKRCLFNSQRSHSISKVEYNFLAYKLQSPKSAPIYGNSVTLRLVTMDRYRSKT